MRHAAKEVFDWMAVMHARLEGGKNRKTTLAQVDDLFTEDELLLAHRGSRIEMLQGRLQRLSPGVTFPPVHGTGPEPANQKG